MNNVVFPIECSCSIKVTARGNFELRLNNLPHPVDEKSHNTVVATGSSLGTAFFNMGHHLMLLFEKQAPGFLDSVVADVLYPKHVS